MFTFCITFDTPLEHFFACMFGQVSSTCGLWCWRLSSFRWASCRQHALNMLETFAVRVDECAHVGGILLHWELILQLQQAICNQVNTEILMLYLWQLTSVQTFKTWNLSCNQWMNEEKKIFQLETRTLLVF